MLVDNITLIDGAKISNLVVGNGTAFPTGAKLDVGELFFRSDLDALYYYSTSGWVTVGETKVNSDGSLSVVETINGSTKTYSVRLTSSLKSLNDVSSAGIAKRTDGPSGTWSVGKVNLSSDVSGSLKVENFNNGANATSSTFWRGDGTWGELGPSLTIPSGNSLPAPASSAKGNLFFLESGNTGLYIFNGSVWISTGTSSSAGNAVAGKIISTFAGSLSSIVGSSRYYHGSAITLTSVYFSVGTTTPDSISINVKRSGQTVFSGTVPSISANAYLSNTVNIDVPVAASDWLTIDLIVVGTGWQDATIVINYI